VLTLNNNHTARGARAKGDLVSLLGGACTAAGDLAPPLGGDLVPPLGGADAAGAGGLGWPKHCRHC
jgi:hypothetical protein